MENSIEKIIVEYLIESGGATSVDIAERFLKFKSPNEKMAEIPVSAVFKGVSGVNKDENGLWTYDASIVSESGSSLLSQPWAFVSIMMTNDNKPMCLSVSTIENSDDVSVFWFINPEVLDEDLQVILRSGNDKYYNSYEKTVEEIYKKLLGKIVVSETFNVQGTLAKILNNSFYTLSEDTYLLNDFLRAIDKKRAGLGELYREFYEEDSILNSAFEINKTFNYVVKYILEKLESKGVKMLDDFITLQFEKKILADWTYLSKTVKDIRRIEKQPGVYGFTDNSDNYIYIGKAKDLQRRLLTYFKISDESPAKLKQLREMAYDLKIHRCGSELESLLYEQRLIQKYRPVLNKKIEFNERLGTFNYLDDSIIVLPHSDNEKIVTLWLRKEQKVRLSSFPGEFQDDKFISELDDFFFSPKLVAEKTDFQEIEIVNRWVKLNREGVNIIPVINFCNGNDLFNQIKAEYNSHINQQL